MHHAWHSPVLDWNPRVLQYLHSIKYLSTGSKSASSQQSPSGRRSNWLISSNVRLNCGLNRRSLRPGPIDAMWAWKARRRFLPNSAGYALGWKGKYQNMLCDSIWKALIKHIACKGFFLNMCKSQVLRLRKRRRAHKSRLPTSIHISVSGFPWCSSLFFFFGQNTKI